MKKYILLFGALLLALSSCRSEFKALPTTNTPVHRTATPAAIKTTAILTKTNIPQTPTPQENKDSAVEFPLPMLSKQQIQEVADCRIQELASERYPENINASDLLESFTPASDCDWAVLSYSYAVRNDTESPSQPGLEAFRKAVSNNYGFVLASDIFAYYFDSVPLVKNPQFAKQEITRVEINYTWSGLGEPSRVEHSLTIDQANTNPVVSSSTSSINSGIVLNKASVQDLAQGLNNLLPIDSEVQLIYCYDNYPEWLVTLTFADGTKVDMKSNSNFLYIGGPWHTEIDGQIYLQYSQAFAMKTGNLMKELELHLGEPAAMYCFGGVVFENAFSRFLPPTSTPSPNFTMEAIRTAAAQTVEVQLTQIAAETPTPKP